MLRVQADHGFAGGQNVAQQELEKKALALAGVAQDEDVGVGFVLRPAVQVQDNVGAEAVLSDVEPMRIVFAGVIEGEEIRHGGGGKDPLELGGEDVAARRVGGQKAATLEEEKTVRADLGSCEHGVDLVPESPQALRVFGAELYKHSAVDQGLLIPAHGGDEGFHVLEVRLGVDAPAHVVGISPVHAVFVLGVVDDGVLFPGGGLADIDVEDHAAFFAEMT